MPTAILPMESGSRGSHVHRHGRSHDARGSFSKLSERICDKDFKVVSRLISKSWFQGWSMAPGFKAGFMGGIKAVS